MQKRVGADRELKLLRADITQVHVDAIVNAANQHLAGGGGVDGAIHRAGGPSIMEACRRIGGCPTGSAVATTAGNLPARHVIHAVAPRWQGGRRGEPDLLRHAYRRSMEVADELKAATVAFPSLGTGIYGNPLEPSARIAVETVSEYLRSARHVRSVTFVLFSDHDLQVYRRVCAGLPV